MAEVIRSQGTTNSEKYLSNLAEKSFLNLWSYPNTYKNVGKELCDLLVVCGDIVIIFSVKSIQWPQNTDIDISWPRWFRHAVKESADQLKGAERWITNFPDRIFLDPQCINPLPIKIPNGANRKIYRVAVALGAHEACSEYFNGDSGSFMVNPSIHGDAHTNPSLPEYHPFTVGDVDPSGSFLHVLNDVTLDILMEELDTITDFTAYLKQKAIFARSGNLGHAAGEEELLAYYLKNMIDDDHHGFAHPKQGTWGPNDRLALDIGVYESMKNNTQYKKKKEANRNSYIWDKLIVTFTDHMLAGTTIVPHGGEFELARHELGVRFMTQENRIMRRLLGEGIIGVLDVANNQDRTFRAMMPSPERPSEKTCYIFMTLALPKKKLEGGYEQYRRTRIEMLHVYCLGILKTQRQLERVIGIAMEPPPMHDSMDTTSEDMIMALQLDEWTPQMESEVNELCKHYNILTDGRVTQTNFGIEEYPTKNFDYSFKGVPIQDGNRHHRRAVEARAKKKNK